MEKVEEIYGEELGGKHLAFDGRSGLYTVGPLPSNRLHFAVPIQLFNQSSTITNNSGTELPDEGHFKRQKRSDRLKIFRVDLVFVTKIPLSALESYDPGKSTEAIKVLNIILRRHATKQKCLVVGQSYFTNDDKNFIELGGGLLGCMGIHSHFHITYSGLSLNMNVSATIIVKPGPVIDFLMASQNVRSPHKINWEKAERKLKNLRITMASNRQRTISGLSKYPCNQQLFQLRPRHGSITDANAVQTVEISVHEYFRKHRHIELEYSANLPCINVGTKHPVYYPLELCFLASMQRYTETISSYQRSALLNGCTQGPQEKMKVLSEELRSSQFDSDPMLHACSISINNSFMKVQARKLSAPKLKVGNEKEISPFNGSWSFKNEKLYEPVKVRSWAAVNFSVRHDVQNICEDLIKCGLQKGIQIGPPMKLFQEDPLWVKSLPTARVQQMFRQLKKAFPTKPPEFVLCILSNGKQDDIYGPWKRKCLSEYGIVSQCIASMKINNHYLNNLLLKINVKMGGLNSSLIAKQSVISLVTKIPTIILGMDVCHGHTNQSNKPSIAAVVGSRKWPSISHYRASLRMQLPNVEAISSLFQPQSNNEDKGIILELLQEFSESSRGEKPKQLIIFRDGVGESQFDQILNIELEQIIQACKIYCGSKLPRITLIVAQKRHQTRFFLDGSSDNIPPGIVVDNGLCHPKLNDFYMCPHFGIKGTPRPRHYHVLLDEICFSPNELQELVHLLSYIYQRSNSAISDVAPLRYAHLAAAQMAQMVGVKSSSRDGLHSIPELPKLHDNVCNTMFFC